MRTALCTQDGVTYQAVDFNQTEDFLAKKRFLVCPHCQGPAFYRGSTRNGREACFGARPHAEGCILAAPEHDGTITGQGTGEDEIFTTGQRIVLDFNFGAPIAEEGGQQVGATIATVDVGVPGGAGDTVREIMTRRMSSLLRSLMESEEFRGSTQIIEVAGKGEFTVADFFVNFADVTDDKIGRFHGFWGMVPDAGIAPSNGSLWFNSGGRENLSVYLDHGDIAATYQRFNIQEEGDIAGAYILVLGRLRRAQGNGKKYVGISDPECFTLRIAR